ncbi:DUF5994 family protein [Nocardia iowensis]|uniref:Uncharacterized protein n=1 Tax=Nocardia iowensis TaxID=204891 RepID=A0ABX8RM44_NOCIO|nr:DUF5994 family protein [Nocardia iowensis]QXN89987.1 hypothetical protein KV110_31760 [Nocardia iowensis]
MTRSKSRGAERTLRLRLKPTAPKTGYVDGAWWPHTYELATELPALLAAVADRIGPIHHVAYPLDEWARTAGDLVIAGQTVRVEGIRHGTMHTVEMLGVKNRRVVLLVVPPTTGADDASVTMSSASAVDNESAVDELLTIGTRERGDRVEGAAAVQRWISEGGA